MPGRINDEDIQALRERADIGAVVGDYTSLMRAGARLKGLCPFHSEKTPSFTVDPARNLWHCFGCSEGGDVYAFLMQAEALSFPEAVERLARLSGYPLRYEELSPGQRKALGRRTRLAEALHEAATFYRRQLDADAAAPARDYLARRGLTPDAAEHFGLGWAPDRWDALSQHLQGGGFGPDELLDAGLATQGRHGPVDRFRGRVMFPIYDPGGRDVVAFGGRVVPGVELSTAPKDATPPKYINSPETQVYRKSAILYGLNWARAEIQRAGTALVVEGYLDVIGLHLVGVRNAVATCGTALTAEHFRQLEKFAPKVVLALDADEAGFAAAERARSLAEEVGVRQVGVLSLPEGRDPADLAGEGAQAVEVALKGVQTAVEFQLTHLLRTADVSTPEGQVAAYRATFPLLARLPDRFLRFTYIRDLVAPAVRLAADRIERELDSELTRHPGPAARDEPAAPPPPVPGDLARGGGHDPQMALEADVLRAALQMPELLPETWSRVTADDFRAPLSRTLFAALGPAPGRPLDEILAALPDDEIRSRVRALALSEPTITAEVSKVADLVARLRAAAVQRELEDLRQQLAVLNAQTDAAAQRRLSEQLFTLERRRRDLLEGREV